MTTNGTSEPTGRREARRPPGLLLLVAVLALEAVAIAGITLWLVVELLTTRADTLGGGIAIVVLAAIATGWVVATTLGAFRTQSWMRGSALTLQLILIAVAIGAFQGQYAQPDIGWALLVPALLGIAMILLPSVVAATRRDVGGV